MAVFFYGLEMHFCFIDEAGDSQAIQTPNHNVQPVLVISALFVDGARLKNLTEEFILLKKRFFPTKFSSLTHDLDALIKEIKGDELRKTIRDNSFSSAKAQTVLKFIDSIFSLLKKHEVKIASRIWVKSIGVPLTDKSIYTITTQQLCLRFEEYLNSKNAEGMVIADYRDPGRNGYVAHSIFTMKNRKIKGDPFPSIVEIPTFAISDNHACLQMCDILSTTIIFPSAAQVYCTGHINNSFINPNYTLLRDRYKKRLKALQFHFKRNDGVMHWGITAKDPLGQKKGLELFG